MALDKERLGELLMAKVDAVTEEFTGEAPVSSDIRKKIFEAMAAAIIEEFQANAVVNTTVSTTVATTGTAAAQAGTGQGSGQGGIS